MWAVIPSNLYKVWRRQSDRLHDVVNGWWKTSGSLIGCWVGWCKRWKVRNNYYSCCYIGCSRNGWSLFWLKAGWRSRYALGGICLFVPNSHQWWKTLTRATVSLFIRVYSVSTSEENRKQIGSLKFVMLLSIL